MESKIQAVSLEYVPEFLFITLRITNIFKGKCSRFTFVNVKCNDITAAGRSGQHLLPNSVELDV